MSPIQQFSSARSERERERDAAMRRSVLAEVQRCTAPHISDRHDITYGHRHSQSGNTVGLVPPPRTNHVPRAAGRGRRSPPGAVGRIPPGGRGRGAAAGRDAGPAGRAHNISPLFGTAGEAVPRCRRSPGGLVSSSDERSSEEWMAVGAGIVPGGVVLGLSHLMSR